MKKEYSTLERFQRGLGKQVSQILFSGFTNREKITKKIHPEAYNKQKKIKPNKTYIDRHINDICNEWKKNGFIESKITYGKDRWNHKIKKELIRLNFEPLYYYFMKQHGITLTQKEKKFLESREMKVFRLQLQRGQILKEYPDDSILDAIIKFYLKHNALLNIEILDKKKREILDMTEKHIEGETKYGEALKSGLLKKRDKPSVLRRYFKKLKAQKLSLEERKEWGDTFEHLFSYVLNYKTDPEIVTSINLKFKKALGIA